VNGGVGACFSALENKGGLAQLLFELYGIDLLFIGLLDLTTDEFRSSSRRFSQFGATGYLERNRWRTLIFSESGFIWMRHEASPFVGAMRHVLM
jgi:hypothetical protein